MFATNDFKVTVDTPRSKLTLIDSGIYRVDVDGSGMGKVAVWKGKAYFGDDSSEYIKSGREGSVTPSGLAIAKFDRGDKDELETWSKDRAKDLAKITGRLQRDNMRTALMSSYLGGRWNMYNSFGLWVYDPFRGFNCFLPFGLGWGSPYGYGFGSSIWYYNLPNTVFGVPTHNGPVRVVRGVKPGRTTDAPGRPPFAQVQGSSGATGRDFSPIKPGRIDSDPGFDPAPVRSSGGFPSVSVPTGRVVQDSKPGRP